MTFVAITPQESKGVPNTHARFMCYKCMKESTANKGSTRRAGMFICAECSKPKQPHVVHLPSDDSEGGLP